MIRRWIVAILLCVQAVLVGWIGWCSCPNKTESGHMGATVYFWHSLRFDVFNVNPPLTRMITGLPVAMCKPEYDWGCYSSRPQDRSEWPLGIAFIKANEPEKTRWCFVLARWSLIPVMLLGGYIGFRMAREIFGDSSAFVFLALWCFSPLLLAWGATICPDVAAAAFGMIAIYAFYRWLHGPTWTRAAIAGGCLGLLPLTKITWIIAFGLWPLIWCLWTMPLYWTRPNDRALPLPPLRQLATMLLLALYTLNMGYMFDGACRPLGQYVFISEALNGLESPDGQQTPQAGNRFADTWLGAIPIPFPAEFVQGIDTQRFDFERGMPSYLRGEWADHGWWYYYLYALAIKEPLGMWCLALVAAGMTVCDWRKSRSRQASPSCLLQASEGRFLPSWREEMVVIVPFVAILVVVSSQTGFSLHTRYVIPAMPFLFVWVSKVGRVFGMRPLTGNRLVLAATVVSALVWSVGSSLFIYPHSLSYFNELAAILPTPADVSYPKAIETTTENSSLLTGIKRILTAGPRNGARHLLDSNIDWGQDLFCLEQWYESHPTARPIQIAYSGTYPLDRSKIESAGCPPTAPIREESDETKAGAAIGPKPGWYAVSVNEIFGRSQRYRYFLNFEPVAMAGYSIHIYHVTLDEANRVRRELGMEELLIPR